MRISRFVVVLLLITVGISLAQEVDRPLVLITNDDGYASPGLVALARQCNTWAEVVVVAPKENCSGSGQSIIYKTAIAFGTSRILGEIPVYWVQATPATTAAWGIRVALKGRKPDLVISGINRGSNLGDAVYYSGTIGAAREAAMAGIPAIAASLDMSGAVKDFEGAAKALEPIAKAYLELDKRPELLNVNFPAGIIPAEMAIRYTRASRQRYSVEYIERDNPRYADQKYFWIKEGFSGVPESGSDYEAIQAGMISVTPLVIDATDTAFLDAVKQDKEDCSK